MHFLIVRRIAMKNNKNQPSLLIVDDDRHLLQSMGSWLVEQGFNIFLADSCESANDILAEHAIDLALVDLRLGDEDGFEVLNHCRENYPKVTVVLMTGY